MRIALLFLLPFFSVSLWTQTITIGPGGDYPTLEDAESAISPGDEVIVLDGIYSDGTQFLYDLNGTAADPIVIRSETLHGAIFQGGTEAIHLVNCSHLVLDGFIIEAQTGNGINIDDGGDYASPTHHITVQNCIFRDMAASGNNDFLKLSGLDSFLVRKCEFTNGGGGGSGIDMVGCHRGVIEDNEFDDAGTSGIQAKGGTQYILMQRNLFRGIDQRAINLGGSTGLQYFRPPLPDPIVDAFEAADLQVFSNIFIGSWAPIAYVGCVRVLVFHNTFYLPENWVIRILQETTEPGFLPCSDNEFRNNIVYLEDDLTEVNIGPNTEPQTFRFSNNLWYNEDDINWTPVLPVTDSMQIIDDPAFVDPSNEDFSLTAGSPAIGAGKNLAQPETDYIQNFYASPPSSGAFEGNPVVGTIPYEFLDTSITIRPNPSANRVVIEGDFSNAEIRILDPNGITVQDHSNAGSPLTINLEDLPAGLYFLELKHSSKPALYVHRIVKMDN